MADGYWAIRRYQAGPVGEMIKFWVPGRRPDKRGGAKKNRALQKAAQNQQSAAKTVARLLNENFREGDLLLGLDYADKALDKLRGKIQGWDAMDDTERAQAEWHAARADLAAFIRRLRARMQKAGEELRYIAVTSDLDEKSGELVRVHHHLVVCREAKAHIMAAWKQGGVDYEPMSAQPDYTPIAAYLIRQVRHVEDAKKYVSSRNLVRPAPKDQIARGPAVLRAPKGALLVDAGANVPGRAQYIRYILPDAAEQGEETMRKGVRGLKVSDWHRRMTPGMIKHGAGGDGA